MRQNQQKNYENLIENAKKQGATDVIVYENFSQNLCIDSKSGELENLTSTTQSNYTMKIFIGKKVGIINANNVTDLENMIPHGIQITKLVPENKDIQVIKHEKNNLECTKNCKEKKQSNKNLQMNNEKLKNVNEKSQVKDENLKVTNSSLEKIDENLQKKSELNYTVNNFNLSTNELIQKANETSLICKNYDKILLSQVNISKSIYSISIASSDGFCDFYTKEVLSFSSVAYAQDKDEMQRDYDYEAFVLKDEKFEKENDALENNDKNNSANNVNNSNNNYNAKNKNNIIDIKKFEKNKKNNDENYNRNAFNTIDNLDQNINDNCDIVNKFHTIAQNSAKNAIKRLGSKKIASGTFDVFFSKRVASQFLAQIIGAFSGYNIANKNSFLHDKLNCQIFNPQITIYDKAFVPGGLRNAKFDADTIECSDIELVSNGIICNFLLNLEMAAKLNMKTTGHAEITGISPHNLYIKNGQNSYEEIVKKGKYIIVTEALGQGINITNAAYAQGIAGFLVEVGGEDFKCLKNENEKNVGFKSENLDNGWKNCNIMPINEVTISGNLYEMFLKMIPCNDLEFKNGIDSPSLFFPQMNVAGV